MNFVGRSLSIVETFSQYMRLELVTFWNSLQGGFAGYHLKTERGTFDKSGRRNTRHINVNRIFPTEFSDWLLTFLLLLPESCCQKSLNTFFVSHSLVQSDIS